MQEEARKLVGGQYKGFVGEQIFMIRKLKP